MDEKPLYDYDGIKIEYYSRSPSDHLLTIGEHVYILQRGVLEHLAIIPMGKFESKLCYITGAGPHILCSAKKERIEANGLHVAFCQAYIEDERRRTDFSREHLSSI